MGHLVLPRSTCHASAPSRYFCCLRRSYGENKPKATWPPLPSSVESKKKKKQKKEQYLCEDSIVKLNFTASKSLRRGRQVIFGKRTKGGPISTVRLVESWQMYTSGSCKSHVVVCLYGARALDRLPYNETAHRDRTLKMGTADEFSKVDEN
ncbi:putative serine-rich protein C21513-like isoform X1 [Vespula squamosa]|uniref:Serine-rich protein C21513-like isoform X1 n=1 Tax=Vespula squamosa TaxID=30214 RepID=A0ABD2C616_VESSQ